MKDQALDETVGTLVRADPGVVSLLFQEPDLELIPFMGTRERFFLLLSLVLSDNAIEVSTLSFLVRRVAFLVVPAVAHLPALEIAIFVLHRRKLRRVLRLSITAAGYPYVSKLTDNDLLLKPIYPGIKCLWDIERPESANCRINIE